MRLVFIPKTKVKSKWNPEIILTYNTTCFISEFFSKINFLNLSLLYSIDNARKKATNAFPNAKGLPKVKIFRYSPGKLIPIKIKNE